MAAKTDPEEYSQVAGWLMPLSQAMESQGLDSAALFKAAGVDPALMTQGSTRLSSRKVDELWRHAFASGADLALGLDYARFFQPGNLYVLAFGLHSSLSLQQASEHLLLPLRLLTYAAVVDCHISDGEFHVDVSPSYQHSVHEKQIFFHAVLLGIWRSLAGADLRPSRVQLHNIAEPQDPAVWARICQHFGCPVIFNAENSRISLPLLVAQAPLPAANPELVSIGDSIIQRYLHELDLQHNAHNPVSNVVQQVINKLSSGRYDRGTVARELGISTSSLQRRLAAEGLSFSQLLSDTRRNLAARYLQESRRPIKDIAYSLGFADLSNFTRAFRSWFGTTPREYRRLHNMTENAE